MPDWAPVPAEAERSIARPRLHLPAGRQPAVREPDVPAEEPGWEPSAVSALPDLARVRTLVYRWIERPDRPGRVYEIPRGASGTIVGAYADGLTYEVDFELQDGSVTWFATRTYEADELEAADPDRVELVE